MSIDGIHPEFHFDVRFLPRCVPHMVIRRYHQFLQLLTLYRYEECQTMVTNFGDHSVTIYWPSKYLYVIISMYSIAIHKCYDDFNGEQHVTPDCFIERRMIDMKLIIHDPLFKKYIRK